MRQSLTSFKNKDRKLFKDVNDNIEEIKLLSDVNNETVTRIKALGDELQEDTDEEPEEETTIPPQKGLEEGKNANILKCEMCEFTTTGIITYNKHMNTKRPVGPDDNKVNTTATNNESKNSSDMDLFSLEIVGDEVKTFQMLQALQAALV